MSFQRTYQRKIPAIDFSLTLKISNLINGSMAQNPQTPNLTSLVAKHLSAFPILIFKGRLIRRVLCIEYLTMKKVRKWIIY